MTVRQEARTIEMLAGMGWERHHGIGGSYWSHPSLGGRTFSGRVDELLDFINLKGTTP
jgi:hypothetical protein